MTHDLKALFKPRSVALIGASNDSRKYGYWTAKSLVDNRFDGRLYMVSRTKADRIMGCKPYASILDIAEPVDLAVVGIAPKYIQGVIAECAQKKVKCVIVVSTGFGETGAAGKAVEKQLLQTARQGGMCLMGPNCMGNYSAAVNLNTSIIDLAPGPLSLVLQSGNFGIDINVNAKTRGLGYSCWATIGNQVDLRFHDFVDYIKDDAATRVVLLYMEGLRVESEADGRRFMEAARAAVQKKPVVAIKIGCSAAGVRAAASHTGSLAGSEAVFDAALRQAGVIRVESSTDLLDVAEAFVKCAPAKGNRIAVLTDGGGHGVMAVDKAERFGLAAPELSAETQDKLRRILMPHCPVKNPVDLAGTPEADMWVFDRCAAVLLNDPQVDGLIIVGLYGGYADLSDEFRRLEMDVAESLLKRVKASGKPVVMHSMYQPYRPACLTHLSQGGIPVYAAIESAVQAMGCLVGYQNSRQRLADENKAPAPFLPVDRKKEVDCILAAVRAAGRVHLVETEAREVLRAYGFVLPPHELVQSAEHAADCVEKMGKAAAMKIVSPHILHKSEADGVRLNIQTRPQARGAFDQLVTAARRYRSDADIFGVMVTPMLPAGVECIIGALHDVTFGPTVMFGLGGVFVEVLKDVAFRVAPVKPYEARVMLNDIQGRAVLKGVRGAAPVDEGALAQAVSRLSCLAAECGDIAEVDLNPVMARSDGLDVADARMVLIA